MKYPNVVALAVSFAVALIFVTLLSIFTSDCIPVKKLRHENVGENPEENQHRPSDAHHLVSKSKNEQGKNQNTNHYDYDDDSDFLAVDSEGSVFPNIDTGSVLLKSETETRTETEPIKKEQHWNQIHLETIISQFKNKIQTEIDTDIEAKTGIKNRSVVISNNKSKSPSELNYNLNNLNINQLLTNQNELNSIDPNFDFEDEDVDSDDEIAFPYVEAKELSPETDPRLPLLQLTADKNNLEELMKIMKTTNADELNQLFSQEQQLKKKRDSTNENDGDEDYEEDCSPFNRYNLAKILFFLIFLPIFICIRFVNSCHDETQKQVENSNSNSNSDKMRGIVSTLRVIEMQPYSHKTHKYIQEEDDSIINTKEDARLISCGATKKH